jgi:hypothetical protein
MRALPLLIWLLRRWWAFGVDTAGVDAGNEGDAVGNEALGLVSLRVLPLITGALPPVVALLPPARGAVPGRD